MQQADLYKLVNRSWIEAERGTADEAKLPSDNHTRTRLPACSEIRIGALYTHNILIWGNPYHGLRRSRFRDTLVALTLAEGTAQRPGSA